MGSRGVKGAVDKGIDFANYFCTYGFLYHKKEMLCDHVRMEAYFNAIFQNKHHFHFRGKAVQDVGTGSGILGLSIWSAQAGARKVYGVEATKMEEDARELKKDTAAFHAGKWRKDTAASIKKSILTGMVYAIWNERNKRIFTVEKSSPYSIISNMLKLVVLSF